MKGSSYRIFYFLPTTKLIENELKLIKLPFDVDDSHSLRTSLTGKRPQNPCNIVPFTTKGEVSKFWACHKTQI